MSTRHTPFYLETLASTTAVRGPREPILDRSVPPIVVLRRVVPNAPDGPRLLVRDAPLVEVVGSRHLADVGLFLGTLPRALHPARDPLLEAVRLVHRRGEEVVLVPLAIYVNKKSFHHPFANAVDLREGLLLSHGRVDDGRPRKPRPK